MRKIALTIIFAMVLAPGLYSQDGQKGGKFVISDMSGGLASKISPHSLKKNQAQVAENLRFNSKYGSVSRRANLNTYGSADATEAITGLFRHYMKDASKVLVVSHGDEIEAGTDLTGAFSAILALSTGDRKWQFTTWHDILIGCDGYNQPIKYDGSSVSATYLGAPLATLHTAGTGPATGVYSYKVSCYGATKEVLLNVASNEITADGNDVNLSMIPICNDVTLNAEAITGRKIYRTKTSGSTYYLLSNGTVANNTAVTLTDSDTDAEISATVYPAGDATWKPPLGRFPLVQNNRLFFGNDPANNPSRLFYSSDGSHEIFDTSNEAGYFDIRQDDGDTITAVEGILGILTVFKNNSIQKLYIDGSDPDTNWSIGDPFTGAPGCQAPYSVASSPYGLIYLAKDGIYRFSGQFSELLSESVTPEIQDISPTNLANVWGIYHDNMYHMAYNSEKAGESYNNRVLVLDVLAEAYSIDLLNINAFTAFNSGNDWGVLYAGASTSGAVWAYSGEVTEIVHARHSDFAGLWDDARYLPETVGGVAFGDVDSPVLEIARTETIDDLSGTINAMVGDINRQDTDGNYISQPIAIGAVELDKIYWNETVPSAGGDVTFQVRTSATGEENLLLNDGFEFWDNWVTGSPSTEQPNDWTFTQDGTGGKADESTAEYKADDTSVEITKSNADQSYVSIAIPNPTNYRGKTLVFTGWVKSANTVGSKVRLQLIDGTSTGTANYANGAGWEELATTISVASDATAITAKCVVETGADAVAYFDKMMVIEASSAENDWTDWSAEFTDSSGSDISGETAGDYIQYLINLSTDDIDYTPNVVRIGDHNVKLTYSKEGTPQSSNVPFHYRTGYLDFGSPSRSKIIRKIEAYHEGTEGEYTIKIENFEGDSDSFEIDLSEFTDHYEGHPTTGAFVGEIFVIDITNNDATAFAFDKLIITYEVEPDVS